MWPHLARNVAIYGVCADTTRVYDGIVNTTHLRFTGLFEDRRSQERIASAVTEIDGGVDDLISLIRVGRIDEIGHLPQRIELDGDLTILETVRAAAAG